MAHIRINRSLISSQVLGLFKKQRACFLLPWAKDAVCKLKYPRTCLACLLDVCALIKASPQLLDPITLAGFSFVCLPVLLQQLMYG